MKRIAIIGAGFSGTMTAVHLIRKSVSPVSIMLINRSDTFSRGIAYTPYSRNHLLNVTTKKMSAFPDAPDHFVNWVMNTNIYLRQDRDIIANSFLPRYLYGEYIEDIWNKTLQSPECSKCEIINIDATVEDVEIKEEKVSMTLHTGQVVSANYCVIATGNHVPRNPEINNKGFYESKNYFQNPWMMESVINTDSHLPVLIIGNGLTMVDSVIGLLEHGFENSIYSISPNGFNILPHRHSNINYTKLVEELSPDATLNEIVSLFNKHIKELRAFGISAEPVIDSIRPYTQQIWQRLSPREKKNFMARFRHLWGVARHRIPLHIYHKIQQLRLEKRLHIYAGKIINMEEMKDRIRIDYYNKRHRAIEHFFVSRVINCTGPETDILRLQSSFLKKCLMKGIIAQDELKLGINADTNSYQVTDNKGRPHDNLFVISTNLKGMLWESTAVPEIRQQAEQLANSILRIL